MKRYIQLKTRAIITLVALVAVVAFVAATFNTMVLAEDRAIPSRQPAKTKGLFPKRGAAEERMSANEASASGALKTRARSQSDAGQQMLAAPNKDIQDGGIPAPRGPRPNVEPAKNRRGGVFAKVEIDVEKIQGHPTNNEGKNDQPTGGQPAAGVRSAPGAGVKTGQVQIIEPRGFPILSDIEGPTMIHGGTTVGGSSTKGKSGLMVTPRIIIQEEVQSGTPDKVGNPLSGGDPPGKTAIPKGSVGSLPAGGIPAPGESGDPQLQISDQGAAGGLISYQRLQKPTIILTRGVNLTIELRESPSSPREGMMEVSTTRGMVIENTGNPDPIGPARAVLFPSVPTAKGPASQNRKDRIIFSSDDVAAPRTGDGKEENSRLGSKWIELESAQFGTRKINKLGIVVRTSDGKEVPYAEVQIKHDESGKTTSFTADAAGCVSWAPTKVGKYVLACDIGGTQSGGTQSGGGASRFLHPLKPVVELLKTTPGKTSQGPAKGPAIQPTAPISTSRSNIKRPN